jgi:hypothetical protein
VTKPKTLLEKALSIPRRKNASDLVRRIQKACDLRAQGKTKTEIGQTLGVSRERARQYLLIAERTMPDIHRRAADEFGAATARPGRRVPLYFQRLILSWLRSCGYLYCRACVKKGMPAVKRQAEFPPKANKMCHACLNARMKARYRLVVNPHPRNHSGRMIPHERRKEATL